MNIYWVRNGVYQTPSLARSTILPGITRKTVLDLLQDKEVQREVNVRGAEEADITIENLIAGIQSGEITEMGGTGTAAVVAQIGRLYFKGEYVPIHGNTIGPVTKALHTLVADIQYGRREEVYGWMREVPSVVPQNQLRQQLVRK